MAKYEERNLMTSCHEALLIRSLLLMNQKYSKKSHDAVSKAELRRSWIKQTNIIHSIINDNNMEIVRQKKFIGTMTNFSENSYSILLDNGKTVHITHDVCHRFVSFPINMLDENGIIKTGERIHLYQPEEHGNFYPDHAIYDTSKAKSQKAGITAEEIMSLPELPIYSQELVRILLRRNLQTEELETYLNDLIVNKEQATPRIYRQLGLNPFPEESQTVEYKEGVVRGASDTNHGLIISRTIAAFANADGGTIFCGIQETNGKPSNVVGIEDKIESLDRCQLDIRNAVLRYTSSENLLALLDFNFYQYNGHLVLAIDVRPSKNIIFINGSELVVRTGNQCLTYKNESITSFILERLTTKTA